MHNKRLLLASVALALSAMSQSAHAYQLETSGFSKVRWLHNSVTFERVTATFRSGDTTAILQAVSLWNQSPANFTFKTVAGDAGWGFPNGENEIVRTTSPLVGSRPGTCLYWFDPFTGNLVEADILINDADGANRHDAAKSSWVAYGGGRRALVSLMLHELGHGLGLKHEADLYNVMGVDFTHVTANGSSARAYPGADAGLGASVLYGFDFSVADVGVTHFAYDPVRTTGEYSAHRRTFVRDIAGRARPRVTGTGAEPVYRIWPGGTVMVEFTYENLGALPQPVDVTLRLSPDDRVTAADAMLRSSTMLLAPGVPHTTSYSVTIPASTAPGRYFIGPVVVGRGGDSVSANNATYVGVEVLPDACSAAAPCGHRLGDCDSDAQCVSGATCRHNVGASYGAQSTLDVCEYPLGHADYCVGDGSCRTGEGDCDSDADCLSGYCMENAGPMYGLPSWVDVCG